MATLTTKLIMSLVDRVSGPAKGMSKAIQGLQREQSKTNAAIKRTAGQLGLVTAAGAGLVAAFAAPVNAAADFESAMSNVSTLVDESTESISDMGKSVLQIGRRVPVAINDLTESLYNVRSAGIDAGDAMNVLENSAKLGVAGLGTTAQSVDLVTSAINAFGLEGEAQAQIYDQIFTAVKNGKTTIAELSQGFGAVAGTMANANIQTDQYLSMVAALTTTGLPAAQAHTQIRAAVSGLTRETKESAAVFKKLGVKSFKDLVKQAGGPVKALQAIREVVGDNDAALLKLLGSTEALNAVLGLTGDQNEAYTDTLNDMRDGVSNLDGAFAKQAKTNKALRQTFNNTFQGMAIAIGNALLPAVNSIMEKITPFISRVADLATEFPHVTRAVAGVSLGLISLTAAVLAAKLAMLSLKSGGIYALIAGLRGARAAGRIAAIGMAPFNLALRGIKASAASARMAMIGFAASAKIGGLGAGFAAMGSGMLSLLNPIKLVRFAFIGMRVALISTGVGAIALGIAAAGTAIYNNWSGIKAMFAGFGQGFMAAVQPIMPAIQPVIDGVNMLKSAWQALTGNIGASDQSWAEFGVAAGQAVGNAVNAFIGFPAKVIAAIGQIDLISAFVNPVSNILGWFSGLASKIIAAIGRIDLSGILKWPSMPKWLGGSGGASEPVQKNATGGLIKGPGTGTSDSILSRLSNGEFVVRAAAVQKFGVSNLEAINSMRLPSATGGVSPRALPVARSLPAANQNARPAANASGPASVTFGNIIVQGGANASAQDIRKEFSREAGALMRAQFSDGVN